MLLFIIELLVIVAIIRLYLYWNVVWGYAYGQSTYRRLNPPAAGGSMAAQMWVGTREECVELVDEIREGRVMAAVDELCDVNHGLVQTGMLWLFPGLMVRAPIYWLVYLMSPYSAHKQGLRFVKTGCTRSPSHHSEGVGIGHICPH
jgi:hypothetical protein